MGPAENPVLGIGGAGIGNREEPAGEEKTSRALYAAWLLVWAAGQVHYGAVAPEAVAATALALAGLYGASLLLLPGPAMSKGLAGVLLAGLGVFAVQLLPLDGLLFPENRRWRDLHGVGGGWAATADLFLTVRALAQTSAYVLTGLLLLRLRRAGLPSKTAFSGIAAVLALQAAWGAAGLGTPFYPGGAAQGDVAHGTFVNRNTFAGVMAMGLVAAAALAWRRDRRLEETKKSLFASAWPILAAGLMVVALVLSRSRGGAVAAAAGLLLLPFLQRGGASLAAAGAVVALGLAGAALAEPELLLERFEAIEPASDSRVRIWASTLHAARAQPVLGFGIDTHPHAFHPWQPPSLPGQVHHAHNEYVNAAFEGGAVFVLVLLGGLALWTTRALRGAARYAGPERLLPVAAVAAVGAAAVHALVDMDLRVTSAGLLFAAFLGLGASLGRPPASRSRLGGTLAAAVAVLAAVATLALPREGGLGRSPYDYQAAWRRAEAARASGETAEADIRYAIAGDLWPAHPGLQGAVGLYHWTRYAETADRAHLERSSRAFRRLFEQRPAEVPEVMAFLPSGTTAEREALLPAVPEAWGAWAGWLAERGFTAEAQAAFGRGAGASTAAHDRYAASLGAVGQWGLEAAVRERRLRLASGPGAHAAAARAWLRLGAHEKALEQAGYACRTDPASPSHRALKADILLAQGRPEEALAALAEALSLAPRDPGLLRRREELRDRLAAPPK